MVSARSTIEKIRTYDNTPLEVQFGLEQVILGVRIVASMTSVDLVIGAPVSRLVSTTTSKMRQDTHNMSGSSTDSLSEAPEIELVGRLIVDDGVDSEMRHIRKQTLTMNLI